MTSRTWDDCHFFKGTNCLENQHSGSKYDNFFGYTKTLFAREIKMRKHAAEVAKAWDNEHIEFRARQRLQTILG